MDCLPICLATSAENRSAVRKYRDAADRPILSITNRDITAGSNPNEVSYYKHHT
jgi:hypothetical protein